MKTKDDALKWIKQFLNEVDTQDNRCTAKPVMFLLQTKAEYVAHDEYCGSNCRSVYRHPGMEGSGCDSMEEARKWVKEFYDGQDIDRLEIEFDKIEEFNIGHYWDTQEVCFTKNGVERHLAQNKHNYRKYRDFVIHAFRNPEIHELFEALRLVSGNNKETSEGAL